MKKRGWFKESARHSLAAKGVKTAKKLNLKQVPMPKTRFPSLRRFYYIIDKDVVNRGGSGRNIYARIFKQTPEGMVQVGERKWNTAWMKGNDSEVLTELQKLGEIPKEMFPDGYYGWSDAEKANVKISRL